MNAIARHLHSLLRRTEGQVGITFALMAIPLLSVTGVAIDYTRALQARSTLQHAADAAALSAARQGNYTQAERREMASAMFKAHLATKGIQQEIAPVIDVEGQTIDIDAAMDVPTTFARIAGHDTFTVAARSRALASNAMTIGGTACVLALNESQSQAFSLNGNTEYQAIDCATYTNSDDSWSMRAVGISQGEASAFYTAGGVSGESNFAPPPIVDQPRLADPLADLQAPYASACSSKSKSTSLKKGNHVVNPGTFCGGLKVQAQANVQFNPGIYVMKNGPLELSSGSSSWGDGVHFHFIGDDAHLKVRGGADADFKAMTSGEYAGILFAQHPDAAPGAVSDVQGGGHVRLVGALYFPTQQVDVGGNGDLGLTTDAWAIIADKIRVHGNGQVRLKADFAAAGFPEILPKIGLKPPHLTR